jgi:peptidoglycan hydrolase CwlO-like protein
MRRVLSGLALCAVIAVAPAWAASQGEGAGAPKAGVEREVAHKSAEVERLQRDVDAQEAKSRDADQKMQQQDQAIAELQRQLKALKGAGAAPGKGS